MFPNSLTVFPNKTKTETKETFAIYAIHPSLEKTAVCFQKHVQIINAREAGMEDLILSSVSGEK